jgi:hypothetical protein
VVLPFTSVGRETEFIHFRRSTEFLNSWRNYFVLLRACNPAGLCSFERSEGVLVMSTKPSEGTIDSASASLSSGTVSGSWSGFDSPPAGEAAGSAGIPSALLAIRYSYAVGLAQGDSQVLAFTPLADGTLSVESPVLPLEAGEQYWLSVLATNAAGLSRLVSSGPFEAA